MVAVVVTNSLLEILTLDGLALNYGLDDNSLLFTFTVLQFF